MGFFSSRRAEPSPLPSSSRSSFTTGSDETSVTHIIRSRFYGRLKKSRNEGKSDLRSPYAPSISSIAEDAPDGHPTENTKKNQTSPLPLQSASKAHLRRTSLDLNSMTLAQRLDELAAANGEGLLDDDEYRLLRQNLFERYSSLSAVPSETPIVPSIGPKTPSRRVANRSDPPMRTASIRTQSSISSAVSNLVRKATRRSKSKTAAADNESVRSLSSRTSSNPLGVLDSRHLGRQVSSVSLNTQSSRAIPHDLRSIVSARSARSTTTQSERYGSGARSVARSIRNGDPPPSSFSSRRLALWAQEDDSLRSAAEIRSEIAETESEAQRLLDAFNGLEMSALTRHRKGHASPLTYGQSAETKDSAWTLIPDQASGFGPDVYCGRKIMDRGRTMLEGSSYRLHQLSSSKLVISDSASCRSARYENGLGISGTTDSSDYSALVNATIQTEVEDIRRRKIDVTDRYQQRLDYLRARLKGAEIHERLLCK